MGLLRSPTVFALAKEIKMSNTALIDLKGISEPVKKLIECISTGVGILYEPTRIRKTAEAELYSTILKKVGKDLSELEKRTFNRIMATEIKRQVNIDEIIRKSIEFTPNELSTSEKPCEDWMLDFFDLCKNSSSEGVQMLWAKLLAGEVDQPGSFSRRTLHAIKLLTTEQAELFTKVCGCIWRISGDYVGIVYALILDSDEDSLYTDDYLGSHASKAYMLESLGFANYKYYDLEYGKEYLLEFYGEQYVFEADPNNRRLEIFVLTPVGEELYSICGHSRNEAYYQLTMEYLLKKGIKKINKNES